MLDPITNKEYENPYLISEVQWGQRVASKAMSLQQKGHFLVAGAAGAGAGLFNLLMALIKIKIQKATIIKLMTAFKNKPKLRVVAPAS